MGSLSTMNPLFFTNMWNSQFKITKWSDFCGFQLLEVREQNSNILVFDSVCSEKLKRLIKVLYFIYGL
jgi:hypothetical protein